MKIGIASDHRGFLLKQKLTNYLEKKGYNVINYGTDSNESVDYPDYAFKLCDGIISKECDFGIAICGTGIGISIACNKVKGIRCAKVSNEKEAIMTRKDNDANVIALDGKTDFDSAIQMVDAFLNTQFSGVERYKKRIEDIRKYEDGEYVDR